MSVELTDEQYLDLLLQARGKAPKVAPRRPFSLSGCVVWSFCIAIGLATLAGIGLNIAGKIGLPIPVIPPALIEALAGKPQMTFSTPPDDSRGAAPSSGGAAQPMGGGDAAPWPTLTPEQPTVPTATPTPDLALTALAVVSGPAETAETTRWKELEGNNYQYFYDPYALPTAQPAFVQYAKEQCADPEKVKKSALLQMMCGGGDE